MSLSQDEQMQLWGVASRSLDEVALTVKQWPNLPSRVEVRAYPHSKKKAMIVEVIVPHEQSVEHIVGVLQKMMHRTWQTPGAFRMGLVACADRLGKEGYEVTLR